jgi:uncharacterized protein (TIGR00106 family)
MEIAVYPLGVGGGSISQEVSRIFDVLDKCPLTYEITPMGTLVEGPLDDLFTLARSLHDAVAGDDVNRVVTVIRIDDRRSGK